MLTSNVCSKHFEQFYVLSIEYHLLITRFWHVRNVPFSLSLKTVGLGTLSGNLHVYLYTFFCSSNVILTFPISYYILLFLQIINAYEWGK